MLWTPGISAHILAQAVHLYQPHESVGFLCWWSIKWLSSFVTSIGKQLHKLKKCLKLLMEMKSYLIPPPNVTWPQKSSACKNCNEYTYCKCKLIYDQFHMLSLERYIIDKFYIQWLCTNNGFLNCRINEWKNLCRTCNKMFIYEANKLDYKLVMINK